MALRGDLASVDLAQVFQMLALNKKVGLLSIQSTKLWKVLYFDHRGVTFHHNVHRILDRVVAAHVRTGRLTEAQIDEVRDHAARMGQPLADSLLAGGYLEPGELEGQYRIELDEEIYDLFFVREAKFEFHEGATAIEGRDGTIDERFFSNCDSVIMEAARRIDEWTYITERVPTTGEVLVATVDAIDAEQFGADGTAIFEQLDGRRNVARVVESTGLSTFQVCKVLSQLLEAEAIAPVATEELLPLADECMNGTRLQDAINLYERAIELGLGLPEAHSSAAKAYQAAGEYEHAIYHLGCEAEHRLASGDRPGAAQRLFQIRALVPTDLRARERLVELTLGADGMALADFDPLAEGKELVDLLIELGDIARVRTLLERLLLVEPDDPDLKKALVNVHVKAGDHKRVAELYESIADDLVRSQKPLEAVAYLQKILLIDRSRTDVSERVRKLYEFDERSRRRSRALAVLAVLFCLLLVLGSGYWFYNERAEEDFARIDVRESLQREDFAAAQMAYDDFVASHPLTTAVGKANAQLQHIEAERQRFEVRHASERAARDRRLKQIRDEYRSDWARHRELFLGGKAEESLVVLTKVRTLLAAAGAAEDMAWGLEQYVERTFTRLVDYLAESQRLGVDYDTRLEAGDWQAARTLALRLRADFEHTQDGQRCRVPVLVSTRPAGAQLWAGDQPLTRQVLGRTEPVVTPAVVLGDEAAKLVLVARLDGFVPRSIEVDASMVAESEVVLEVVAVGRLDFDAPAQTGVSVAEGWVAVGLRGGRLGLARVDGSSKHARPLPGLKAVDSTPVVQGGRVFFTSNENTIECMTLDTTAGTGAWPASLPSGFASELMVAEGRVAIVDRDGVLHCWEQSSGQKVWSVSLDSAPSGPPTAWRRQVQVGTADGRLLVFDAANGASITSLRSPTGLSTRVLCDRGVAWFGASDGNLRAVELATGRMLWTVGIGRTPLDGQVALGAAAVLVVDDSGALLALDRATGKQLGKIQLDGAPLAGLRIQGHRALLQVRRAKVRNKPSHDVLLAVNTTSMTLLWEYAQAGNGPGPAGSDDLAVALSTTTGEVILFR